LAIVSTLAAIPLSFRVVYSLDKSGGSDLAAELRGQTFTLCTESALREAGYSCYVGRRADKYLVRGTRL